MWPATCDEDPPSPVLTTLTWLCFAYGPWPINPFYLSTVPFPSNPTCFHLLFLRCSIEEVLWGQHFLLFTGREVPTFPSASGCVLRWQCLGQMCSRQITYVGSWGKWLPSNSMTWKRLQKFVVISFFTFSENLWDTFLALDSGNQSERALMMHSCISNSRMYIMLMVQKIHFICLKDVTFLAGFLLM